MSESLSKSNSSSNKHHKVISLTLKIIMAFIGIAMVSLGATFLRTGNLGLDPFTAINIGMSTHLKMSLGTYQLLANLVIVIFVFLIVRKLIGIGSIMNMVLVGFEIQWFTALYYQLLPGKLNFFVIITNLVLGLILFTLGSSIYMAPKLGVAPYDAIAPIFSSLFHMEYKVVRVIQDLCFLIAAYIAGGPVGIASIIVAFFTGPLITYWNKKISNPIVNEINEFGYQPTIKKATSDISRVTAHSYNSLKSAYNTTVDLQQNLADYSNKQLRKQLQAEKNKMEKSQKDYRASKNHYALLFSELKERQKTQTINVKLIKKVN